MVVLYQRENFPVSKIIATMFDIGIFLVATKRLYKSVCPSVRPSVTLSFFGLLGATNAVYTAPLLVNLLTADPSVRPSVYLVY